MRQPLLFFIPLLLISIARAQDNAPAIIQFSAGKWEPGDWKPIRMANQPSTRPFSQLDGAIGSTMQTFTKADYGAETDNAILLRDLGTTEAEFSIRFNLGKGFGGQSCPGLCISPQIKDGVLQSSIAVFVADYTMAVWHHTTDADGKTVRYKHLVQIARHTDPKKPHMLRCRISKKEGSVALKLDEADTIVLSFIGNKSYGSVAEPVNSIVGLWACHGECAFQEFAVYREPSLQFICRQ